MSERSDLLFRHEVTHQALVEVAQQSPADAHIVAQAFAAVQRRLDNAGDMNVYLVSQPPTPRPPTPPSPPPSATATPTVIQTVSSDSGEGSEHACFANIRKVLTQGGVEGSRSVGTHPLHTTPVASAVASAVAGPSSGPLDTTTVGAHLVHVVEEMDSRTVFLLNLMKVGDVQSRVARLEALVPFACEHGTTFQSTGR